MNPIASCLLFVFGVLCIAASLICVKPKAVPKPVPHFDSSIHTAFLCGEGDPVIYSAGMRIDVKGASQIDLTNDGRVNTYKPITDTDGKTVWRNIEDAK